MKLFNFKNAKQPQGIIKPRRKRLSQNAIKHPVERIDMQMQNLKNAVDWARDVNSPVRSDLVLIYEQTEKDGQVESQLGTARDLITERPFEITVNGTDNDQLKELFQRPWFEKFVGLVFDSEFWGYTLLEFQQIIDGEFSDVMEFPRRNYNPVTRNIIVNQTDQTGLPYDGKLYKYFLFEIGDPEDLGKMELITREVIYKNFSRSDWSEFNERFGKPILDIATNTSDSEETSKRARMAANFGRNLWIVRDTEDEVNLLEPKNGAANGSNFENMARYCDEQISKIINGQTGTADDKSYVGAAEVHQDILNKRTRARMKRISNIVNFKLMPFLIHYGYPLEGAQLRYPELDDPKYNNKGAQEGDDPEDDNDDMNTGKKKQEPVGKLKPW